MIFFILFMHNHHIPSAFVNNILEYCIMALSTRYINLVHPSEYPIEKKWHCAIYTYSGKHAVYMKNIIDVCTRGFLISRKNINDAG